MENIGTVLRIEKKKAFIFTSDARIVTIQARKGQFVGEQIAFKDAEIIAPKRYSTEYIFKAAVGLVAAIALVLAGIYAGLQIKNQDGGIDTRCALVVSVDINPGIQVTVNKDNLILEAEAMNEDGEAVLDGIDIKGKTVKQGIRDILDHAEVLGYMKNDTNLIMISAVVNAGEAVAEEEMDVYTEQLQSMFGTLEQEYGTKLFTILSTDSNIINDAAKNNLSVGKEMFYYYASTVGADMTVEEINASTITEIVDILNAADESGSIDVNVKNALGSSQAFTSTEVSPTVDPAVITVTPTVTDPTITVDPTATITVTPSTTPEPTVTVTVNPTATITATPSPSPEPTQTPTPKPTTKPQADSINPELSVGINGDNLEFSWTKVSNSTTYDGKTYSGFNYYKVVASQEDSTPIYPDNGYLLVQSDVASTSWNLNPGEDDYNYNPELIPGETYYFCITYVYDNGKFTSNVVQKKVPQSDSTPAADSISPSLDASVSGDYLEFSWTDLPTKSVVYNGKTYSGFNYYKIVASQTNSTPSYPDDGYLYYLSDKGSSSWSLNPSSGDYNTNPELIPGESYYFSITYVFDNGKFTTNSVKLTVPGTSSQPDSSTDTITPELSADVSGDTLYVDWTPLSGSKTVYNGKTYSGFNYYKVVASETNPKPIYPDDGYLVYMTDIESSSWSLNLTSDDYNKKPQLESGHSYYFAITYVFDSGKFTTNSVQLKMP